MVIWGFKGDAAVQVDSVCDRVEECAGDGHAACIRLCRALAVLFSMPTSQLLEILYVYLQQKAFIGR